MQRIELFIATTLLVAIPALAQTPPPPDETARPETEAIAEPETEAKTEPETEAKTEPETEAKTEPETEAKTEPETEAKAEPETEARAEPEAESEANARSETEAEPETQAQAELRTEASAETPDGAAAPPLAADLPGAMTHEGEGHFFQFPDMPNDHNVDVGFRYVHHKGSGRANEFEELKNSPTLKLDTLMLPYPHRVHIRGEFLTPTDNSLDAMYAYQDIVMLRIVSATSYHNLDATQLVDQGQLAGSTVVDDALYSVRGLAPKTARLGLMTSSNRFMLRLKPHDFPMHLYAIGTLLVRDGDREQRFLGGSGDFSNLQREAVTRKIDWLDTGITVGGNSHLGPLEVDFSHTEGWFSAAGDSRKLVTDYNGSNGGTFKHSVVPDIRRRSNVLKVHSSYSGGLTLSGTFSHNTRENEYSGADSTAMVAAGSLHFIPTSKAQLGIRARIRDLELNNPASLTVTPLDDPTRGQTVGLKKSVESRTGQVTAQGLYRVTRGLSIRARYVHTATARRYEEAWKLPRRTTEDLAGLNVTSRISKTIQGKIGYRRRHVSAPAYNSQHDDSDWGMAEIKVNTTPAVLQLRYQVELSRRNGLQYEADGRLSQGGSGESRRHWFYTFGSFFLGEGVTATAHYAYANRQFVQDLAYDSFGGDELFVSDPGVAYREKVHTLGADLEIKPTEWLEVGGLAEYAESQAGFESNLDDGQLQLGGFSRIRLRQARYQGRILFLLPQNWQVGATATYYDHTNIRNRPLNPYRDGEALIVMGRLGKSWQ